MGVQEYSFLVLLYGKTFLVVVQEYFFLEPLYDNYFQGDSQEYFEHTLNFSDLFIDDLADGQLAMVKYSDSYYYTNQSCSVSELSSAFTSAFIGNCTDLPLLIHCSVYFDWSFSNCYEDFNTDVQPFQSFAVYGNFCVNWICFVIYCDDIPRRDLASLVDYYGTTFLVFIASAYAVEFVELLIYF